MSWQGTLVNIYITPEAGAPMEPHASVEAVEGKGLVGDRYFEGIGSFSRWPGLHREVSLIAVEALAEMEQTTGVVLPPEWSRRNLLTQGVPLNDLIKRDFWIGDVQFRGLRLCQPCKYLVRKTGIPNLLRPLVNRGGLRAQILTSGTIYIGDTIRPSTEPSQQAASVGLP